jgi:pyruvate/2-oxoglutarate dehydrogenase complex dihydrolipoamide dehydrogenase (E3) component
VEMLDEFMSGILRDEKPLYEERLNKHKISIYTGKRLESVQSNGVTIIDKYGKREEIQADSVVIATGFTPNRNLITGLESQPGFEVYEVGDCVEPRKIFDAIHEAYYSALLI